MTLPIMAVENAARGADLSSGGLIALLVGAFAVPFVLSAVCTPLLGRLCRRMGFVDKPREERFGEREVAIT